MKRASRDHSKRFSSPSRRAFVSAAALAAFVAAALLVWAPVRATAAHSNLSAQSAKASPSEFSPLRATEDVSVGRFYMNQHKYDAAISRFEGAVKHDPRWATPHRYLGIVYEKKNDPKHAIDEYREYLRIRPSAKDKKAIEKRIADLSREIKQRNAPSR